MKLFEDALEVSFSENYSFFPVKNAISIFQPCLDAELFSKVAELQPELDAQIEKYEKALEDWRKYRFPLFSQKTARFCRTYGDFATLVEERGMINRKITEKTLELQKKIKAMEK